MSFKKQLVYITLGALALTTASFASTINVINENKKSVKIKIEAEADRSAVSKREISAEHQSSFEVDSSQLNGHSIFSIKGDTSPFTSGGKCYHLNIEKDYKVTFKNDKMGTRCIAEEIKK